MKLSDTAVKKAKPDFNPITEKETTNAYKLSDGGGLYLEVMPTGSNYWRLKYRYAGKEKRLAFGVYPDVSLAQARDRHDDARKLLANGIDPGAVKQAQKLTSLALAENSFEVIAREWFAKHSLNWKEAHSSKIIARLENDIFPWIGTRPVAEIAAPALLIAGSDTPDRSPWRTGNAHRALACCGQLCSGYAVATGRAERDPTGDLRGALPPVKKDKHFAAITEPKKVGELMRDIDGYHGSYIVKCAFKLSPLYQTG